MHAIDLGCRVYHMCSPWRNLLDLLTLSGRLQKQRTLHKAAFFEPHRKGGLTKTEKVDSVRLGEHHRGPASLDMALRYGDLCAKLRGNSMHIRFTV